MRSGIDTGPDQVRRRATAAPRNVSITLSLSGFQAGILAEFFEETTRGGAEAFQWRDFRTGADADYRFLAPPELRAASPRYPLAGGGSERWTATIRLERLPFVTPAATEAAPEAPPGGGDFFRSDAAASEPIDSAPSRGTMQTDEPIRQSLVFEADAPEPDVVLETLFSTVPEPIATDGAAGEPGARTIGTPCLERAF